MAHLKRHRILRLIFTLILILTQLKTHPSSATGSTHISNPSPPSPPPPHSSPSPHKNQLAHSPLTPQHTSPSSSAKTQLLPLLIIHLLLLPLHLLHPHHYRQLSALHLASLPTHAHHNQLNYTSYVCAVTKPSSLSVHGYCTFNSHILRLKLLLLPSTPPSSPPHLSIPPPPLPLTTFRSNANAATAIARLSLLTATPNFNYTFSTLKTIEPTNSTTTTTS
nr:hypothetical protein HmN_000836900 [Hymenolepis microstoma]